MSMNKLTGTAGVIDIPGVNSRRWGIRPHEHWVDSDTGLHWARFVVDNTTELECTWTSRTDMVLFRVMALGRDENNHVVETESVDHGSVPWRLFLGMLQDHEAQVRLVTL